MGKTETTEPTPATTSTPEELSVWTILEETGGDVLLAQKVSRYVGELGALSPKCVMKGWKVIRDNLVARTQRLYDFIASSAPNDLRAEALTPAADQLAVAKGLPTPLENVPVVDLGPAWENPDDGLSGSTTVPREPDGKVAAVDWCGFLARHQLTTPECKSTGTTTWERAAAMWDQNRGTAFLMGYLALQPYIRPAGVVGDLVYWGGVAVYEIGDGVAGWFRAKAATEEQVQELGRLHEMHVRFMQDELRAIYRQCRAVHRIAKDNRTGAAQAKALLATDPKDEQEMPPVWDGTMPDIDGTGGSLPWWILVLVAAGGVGGMALLED